MPDASGVAHRPVVLVTGAGGFIGGHAARRLADEGWRVRAFVRDPIRAPVVDLGHPAIEIVSGSLLDPAVVAHAVDGAEAVVHAAGPTRVARRGAMRAAAVDATRILSSCAVRRAVKQFIFISSFAVYSAAARTEYDERTVLAPAGDDYADAKMAAEAVVREAAGHTRTAILRPPAVYGPGSWYWSVRLLEAARRGRLFAPGGGTFPIVYSFVDNLVDAIGLALQRGSEGVFNVFDGRMPYGDFVQPYADMAGTRVRPMPLWLLRTLAAAAGASMRLAGWWTPLSSTSIEFLVNGHRHAPDGAWRARAELGWTPRVGYADGIARTRRWLLEPRTPAAERTSP